MTELCERGDRIAVDDLGAGYAGLNCFASRRADIVKSTSRSRAGERDALVEMGCAYLQGYLLARPAAPFVGVTWA